MTHDLPLTTYTEYRPGEMQQRADDYYAEMRRRRSVRDFADRPVPAGVIETCLLAAGTAPSGANMQPWHFCVVRDPVTKRRIREQAQARERAFYDGGAGEEWLDALAPLGTAASKPFLEQAPCLIAVFQQQYGLDENGGKIQHYYVSHSMGIALGMLISALHHAGLACLTYTPAPMTFLRDLLGRPKNERPVMLLVVGYPAEDAHVPPIEKKPLDEIATFV